VVTITQTSTSTFVPTNPTTTLTPSTSTSSLIISSSTSSVTAVPSNSGSGLSQSGIIAIAVVVPIAVIALLAILAFFFWRRNRDKKARLAARKGEIEDYGFDPNAPDGASGGPGISAAPRLGTGAVAGAGAAGVGNEMRQTYGEDDGAGYRGWGPTSNNKRPGWVPTGTGAEVGVAAGVGAVAGAGAAGYYNQQRDNSPNPYDPYPNQSGDDYYYPEEAVDHQGAPPLNLPPKSYERYDPALVGGVPSTDYHQAESGTLGVVNTDVQRQPSNASSRYSTVSTDENAGRSYQNSPRFPQAQAFSSPAGLTSGRPGRSTMGTGEGGYVEGDENGNGRYDAVNF
jgi:hypothetical protein